MAILKYLPKVLFFLLFAWISFIPLPLQCRYSFQIKILFVAGFLFLWIKDRRSIFRNGDWPLWLFVAALGCNLYVAVFTEVAIKTYLELIMPLIFIYYLIAGNFLAHEDFVFLARTICVFSLIVALWGLMDVLLRTNFLYETFFPSIFYDRYKYRWPMRAIATQFHAPPLGTYLLASLPFSFLTMKQDRSLYRALGILGLIVTPVAMIFTVSRGVLLSFFCMLLFLLFLKRKTKWIFSILIGCVALMLLAGYFPYPFSKFGIKPFFISSDGMFTSYRFARIQMLGRILADQPLWGIGFNHVRELFYAYYPGAGKINFEFRIMDNMYWTLAAEAGLAGLAAFLVFLGSMVMRGWKSFLKFHDKNTERTRLLLIGAGFFGLLVNAAAYELFYWPSQYMFLCVYIGLIESFSRRSSSLAAELRS